MEKLEENIRTLQPVTSLGTLRYGKACDVEQFHTVIPAGPRGTHASYSSAGEWLRFIHPEGQPYYQSTKPGFSVVTEANLARVEIEEQVLGWLKVVQDEVSRLQIALPQDSELFLELQGDVCNYYFVNYSTQSLFWLEPTSTEDLDISPVASEAHLKWALERFFWVHVEFFPMHHGDRFQQEIIDDLFGVLSHGQADRMTSATSTFPYTWEKCARFLKLLNLQQGRQMDGYTLCYVARLSAAVAHQRFMTFYGHEDAQIDRLQEMIPSSTPDHQWIFRIANGLLWGIPQGYHSQIKEVFINEQVYADHWASFMSNCLREWNTSLSWTFPVLIVSVLLSSGSLITAIPSILCCSAAIASASCLDLKLRPLADASASSAACYLRAVESPTLGFLPSAVAFSLPKACYMWGVGFLIAQIVQLMSQRLGKLISLLAALSLALLVLFIFWVTSTEEVGMRSLFNRLRSLCSIHSNDPPLGGVSLV